MKSRRSSSRRKRSSPGRRGSAPSPCDLPVGKPEPCVSGNAAPFKKWIGVFLEKGGVCAFLLWLLAAFLVVAGCYWKARVVSLQERGVSTTATVVRVGDSTKMVGDSSGKRTWTLHISFEIPGIGRQEQRTYSSGLSAPGYGKGDTIPICYLPDDPSILEIEPIARGGEHPVFFTAGLLAAAGLLVAIRALWLGTVLRGWAYPLESGAITAAGDQRRTEPGCRSACGRSRGAAD